MKDVSGRHTDSSKVPRSHAARRTWRPRRRDGFGVHTRASCCSIARLRTAEGQCRRATRTGHRQASKGNARPRRTADARGSRVVGEAVEPDTCEATVGHRGRSAEADREVAGDAINEDVQGGEQRLRADLVVYMQREAVTSTSDVTPARWAAFREHLLPAPRAGVKRGGRRGASRDYCQTIAIYVRSPAARGEDDA